jgi:hypothetical protein
MITLEDGWGASFTTCIEMCRLATEKNEDVCCKVLGRIVSASPGDNPHKLYDDWGFYPVAHPELR